MQLSALMGPDCPPLPVGGETEIVGLTADSRNVQPGFLFAALPGVNADGARFIPQALDKGAAAILLGAEAKAAAKMEAPVPVVADPNPRRRLALMAARFFGRQPETIAAVTGTNGKTSVAAFVRQIWRLLGQPAASLGTLGISAPSGDRSLAHTTPDPVTLHRELAGLVDEGVTHLAMEASSHGLAQYRLDGVQVAAAAFTNISRDHLDYHPTFGDYLQAKLRLFDEVMAPGGVAVLNADAADFAAFDAVCAARRHRRITVGRNGQGIRLAAMTPHGRGQAIGVAHADRDYEIDLPLVGAFQASNALVAAGLAIGCGADPDQVFPMLGSLKGAPGRLEDVARLSRGASVFVDYAHTPDALATALDALRPHTENRLVVVFGCGGDRDAGKRPQMGAIAAEKADAVFVTDDNPRTEAPDAIRKEILSACPDATEVGDRAAAIEAAMGSLRAGDVLVVAGKGHETGQIVGDEVIPFSDHDTVRALAGVMEGGA